MNPHQGSGAGQAIEVKSLCTLALDRVLIILLIHRTASFLQVFSPILA